MTADAFAELQNDPDLALPPALVPTATALP
jgi:hypothetical protein